MSVSPSWPFDLYETGLYDRELSWSGQAEFTAPISAARSRRGFGLSALALIGKKAARFLLFFLPFFLFIFIFHECAYFRNIEGERVKNAEHK